MIYPPTTQRDNDEESILRVYRPSSRGAFGRIKALFFHGKLRPDANLVQGLPCKNKAFYSPETQHRLVSKVYSQRLFVLFKYFGRSSKTSKTEMLSYNATHEIAHAFFCICHETSHNKLRLNREGYAHRRRSIILKM